MQARLLKALLAVALIATTAWAQSFLGSIKGTVLDSSGAVVPQAKVVLTETGTGTQRNLTTSASGDYAFADLTPGTYIVAISVSGFKEVKSSPMVLTGAQVMRFDAHLDVGASTETVTVAASAPTLNTENAQIAGLQSRDELNNAPTNFRSTIGLFMMNSFNYQGSGSSYSLGGLRGVQTNFTIDGTSSNSNLFGAQSGPNTEVSFESVRDMKFMVSNNSAEFSNVATLFVETRSGENTVHGSAFYNQVNGLLQAKSFFATTRPAPTPQQHQLAGSFGGPVWIPKVYNGRNKTFFFFAFEQNRFPGAASNTASVPTLAFRNGDFSSLLAAAKPITIKDPLHLDASGKPIPFAGNQIDQSRMTISQKIQEHYFPKPNIGAANSYATNWAGYIPTASVTNRFSARIDHQFSEQDSLSSRFTIRNDPMPGQPDNNVGTTIHDQYRRNFNTYMSETHLFSPTLLNEFRLGFTRDHSNITGRDNGRQLLSDFGLTGAIPNAVTGSPEFDFSQNGFVNTYEYPDYEYTSQALEALDNVTWTKGRHNIKAGVNVRHNNPNIANNPGADFGQYTFDGSLSGFDYADFLLGLPSTTKRNFRAPNAYYRWNNVGLYLQDDFKITSKLTLNLGIRWEFNQSPQEKHNILYTFNPANDSVVVPNSQVLQYVVPVYPKSIPIQTAEAAGFPTPGVTNARWTDFAPRVSFAYLPFSGSTFVIRGGYGVFYSPIISTFAGSGVLQGGPFASSETFQDQVINGVTQPQLQFPSPFLATGKTPAQSVDSLDQNLRTPYVQQWNITAERELPGQLVARATYRGFRGDQTAYNWDLNVPPAAATGAIENSYFPYSNFYKAAYTTNGAITKLNAMDLSVERKYISGFTFQSQFTWAKNQSDAGDDGERNGFENPYNRARDMGNVSWMPQQRWVTSVLYDLPFGKGKPFASNLGRFGNGVIGGWAVSGILIEQTGQFLNPGYSSQDILHNRTKSGRPDCVSDPIPSNQTVTHWLNAAAYALPAAGQFGNCIRNGVTGPGMNNLNLGLQKNFHLTEKAVLQFKGTATNALNHPIFSNPSVSNFQSSSFGVITGVLGQTSNRTSVGAAGYRMLQISARIDF